MRDIQSGVGRWGMMQPFDLNFGLAQNTVIDSIVVQWPKKGLPRTTVINPPVNQLVSIDGNGLVTGVRDGGSADEGIALSLSPNPTSDWMTARLAPSLRSNGTLQIFNAMGESVRHEALTGAEYIRVPVETLPEGYYMLRITSNGVTATSPFIRTR